MREEGGGGPEGWVADSNIPLWKDAGSVKQPASIKTSQDKPSPCPGPTSAGVDTWSTPALYVRLTKRLYPGGVISRGGFFLTNWKYVTLWCVKGVFHLGASWEIVRLSLPLMPRLVHAMTKSDKDMTATTGTSCCQPSFQRWLTLTHPPTPLPAMADSNPSPHPPSSYGWLQPTPPPFQLWLTPTHPTPLPGLSHVIPTT